MLALHASDGLALLAHHPVAQRKLRLERLHLHLPARLRLAEQQLGLVQERPLLAHRTLELAD